MMMKMKLVFTQYTLMKMMMTQKIKAIVLTIANNVRVKSAYNVHRPGICIAINACAKIHMLIEEKKNA